MLPKKYQSTPTALANYDYVDVAEGTGTIVYYGCTTALSGSTAYTLTKNVVWPALSGSTAAATGETTYNFDSPQLNTPRTISGTGYASVQLQNGAGSNNFFVGIQYQKWDGTTATNISSEYQSPLCPANTGKLCLIKIPCTQTEIKSGEQIRVTIIAYTNGATNPKIFHNPKGQAIADTTTTVMEFGVPFRLDV